MKRIINELRMLAAELLLLPIVWLCPDTDEGRDLAKAIYDYCDLANGRAESKRAMQELEDDLARRLRNR